MANEIDGQEILNEIKRVGDRLDTRLSGLEKRMSTIEDVVADLDGRIKAWPDMHYLGAAAKAQIAQTRDMKADIAGIKVRMDEIYQAMATDPEVRNLREDVSRFRDQSLENEVWLGVIESHVGIKSAFEPS
jgi:hypothetical protein